MPPTSSHLPCEEATRRRRGGRPTTEPARPCRLLVTGFEAFASVRVNPSSVAVRALGRAADLRRRGLVTAILPVHLTQGPARLAALLRLHRPDVLLLTGVAARRETAAWEQLAANCYAPPGRPHELRPLVLGGRRHLPATLPAPSALRALAAGGLPTLRSRDAGTYLCNAVLYLSLDWAQAGADARAPAPSRVGFLHLPQPRRTRLAAVSAPPAITQAILNSGLRSLASFLLA